MMKQKAWAMRLKAIGTLGWALSGIAPAGCSGAGHDGYPNLVPFGQPASAPFVAPEDPALAARVAALKARASALQHVPVLSAEDQTTLGR